VSFALWSLALAALAMPWGVALRPFRPDHFAIVLFLPVALLGAG
jgi:cell shape-determining protein MreD